MTRLETTRYLKIIKTNKVKHSIIWKIKTKIKAVFKINQIKNQIKIVNKIIKEIATIINKIIQLNINKIK